MEATVFETKQNVPTRFFAYLRWLHMVNKKSNNISSGDYIMRTTEQS